MAFALVDGRLVLSLNIHQIFFCTVDIWNGDQFVALGIKRDRDLIPETVLVEFIATEGELIPVLVSVNNGQQNIKF